MTKCLIYDTWKHLYHYPKITLFKKLGGSFLEFFTNHDSVLTIPGKEEQIHGKILYCYSHYKLGKEVTRGYIYFDPIFFLKKSMFYICL